MTDLPETIWGRKGDSEVTNADVLGFRSPANGANETEYVRADLARVQLAAIVRENCVECAGTGTAREGDGICPYCSQVTPADARAALDRLLAEARAQEREACAKIAENVPMMRCAKCGAPKGEHHYRHPFQPPVGAITDIAAAIRARGAAQEGEE